VKAAYGRRWWYLRPLRTMWVWIKMHIVHNLTTVQFNMMMKDFLLWCLLCLLVRNGTRTVTTPSSPDSSCLVVPGLTHSLRAVQVHAGACSSGGKDRKVASYPTTCYTSRCMVVCSTTVRWRLASVSFRRCCVHVDSAVGGMSNSSC
jgi:hypothetical protein